MSNCWNSISLEKIVNIFDHKRRPLSSMERSSRKGNFPYYGAQGIIDHIDDYIFDGKYILVAEDGENLRSRKQPIAIFAEGKFWVNNHAHIVKAIENKADDYFVLSYLNNINLSAYVTGAAQPKLSQYNLRNIIINLPSLQTQRKIAAILSAYDDLIENNARRIQILEEMAQRIYREWFVHFRFPGHENVKLVDSELGRIPEGWEVKKTVEVMTILGGGTPSTVKSELWENGKINWYVPTDLTKTNSTFMIESEHKINQLGLQKSSAKLFPSFSIMLTSRATIGVISINITEACTNQGFISCIPSEQLSTYQIFYWMKENIEMFKTLASGATFKELTKSVFKNFKIIVPERIISKKFNDFVAPIMNLILNLQIKNINLKQTRDLLLPKLISGKIDVSDLDIETGNLGE